MNAKKCDRCCAFYDIYEGLKLEESASQDRFNRLIFRDNVMSTGLRSTKDFDLCPDCMAGVIDWIKHPEKIVS